MLKKGSAAASTAAETHNTKNTIQYMHSDVLNVLVDTDSVHREDLFKPEDVESRACEYKDQHLGFTCNTEELILKRAAIAAARRCKGSSFDNLITELSKAVGSPILILNDYMRVFNPKIRWDNLEIFGERGFFEVERSV